MKHTIAVLSCAAVLAATLTACGGSDAKATLPAYTGGTRSSATTTSPTATTAPTASASGPVVLAPHTTYTYGGLKVIVNLPANIPKESRTSMILSSDLLQGMGRTTAHNKLDPSLTDLASADVVRYIQSSVVPSTVRTIGSLIFTISNVQARGSYATRAALCLDQSKLIQVGKDGSHFIDPNTKKYPTILMTVDISHGTTSPQVTRLTTAVGSC